MMPFVLSLSNPNAVLENVGGKGASLAKMLAAGLPVPDGFHVTTEAYRRFVAENKIQPLILALAVNYLTTLLALSIFTLSLALAIPTLNAYLSSMAGEHQGTIMGLNSAAGSLGKVLGPLSAGYLYEMNIEYPFISGTGVSISGLLVCIVWLWVTKRAIKTPIKSS